MYVFYLYKFNVFIYQVRKYSFISRKVFKLITIFFLMLRVKKITGIIGKKVYTDTGDFFGEIEESNLVENKVESWRIRVANLMGNYLGGARGVIIPHQFVRAVGDIMIISRASLPLDESDSREQTVDLSEESEAQKGTSIF